MIDNFIAALSLSENALNHLKELPATLSQIDFRKIPNIIYFVYLSEERLYSATYKTLYVYSMSDNESPIGNYELKGLCKSGIIADNHLYLGDNSRLLVFEVTTSLTQPIVPVKDISINHSLH